MTTAGSFLLLLSSGRRTRISRVRLIPDFMPTTRAARRPAVAPAVAEKAPMLGRDQEAATVDGGYVAR